MKETQCNMIMAHIKKHGSITSLEAMTEYGIMRCASRINDLRRRGTPIVSEQVKGVNRDGGTVRYAKYKLLEGGASNVN